MRSSAFALAFALAFPFAFALPAGTNAVRVADGAAGSDAMTAGGVGGALWSGGTISAGGVGGQSSKPGGSDAGAELRRIGQ